MKRATLKSYEKAVNDYVAWYLKRHPGTEFLGMFAQETEDITSTLPSYVFEFSLRFHKKEIVEDNMWGNHPRIEHIDTQFSIYSNMIDNGNLAQMMKDYDEYYANKSTDS